MPGGYSGAVSLLASLDRVNRRHPWSHNDHYGGWVARRVAAAGARRVLDVGCGTGNLVALLRRTGAAVTGIEPDPAVAVVAEERFAGDPGVAIVRMPFLVPGACAAGRDGAPDSAGGVPGPVWDAVTLVAVLHHLPLEPALRQVRQVLAPGGRLVVVGCFREAGPVDLLAAIPALVANPVVGLLKHPARADAPPVHMTAPTAEPRETLAEIRAVARHILPGARIRRRVFWRYTLVWDAPSR